MEQPDRGQVFHPARLDEDGGGDDCHLDCVPFCYMISRSLKNLKSAKLRPFFKLTNKLLSILPAYRPRQFPSKMSSVLNENDENSKGSTDDSGVGTQLNASCISISSSDSGLQRKRSFEDDDVSGDENDAEPECTSRKEKSLGKLCKRFLIAMDEESRASADIHLETVAKKILVEKRRIYDIVNVMEALEAMSKTNKSYYRWHGLDRLPMLMAELAREALQDQLPAKIAQVERAMCSFVELSATGSPVPGAVGTLMSSQSTSSVVCTPDYKNRGGKNSLAHLCRRFLMVLLSNPQDNRRVSLDVASTILIKDPESEGYDPPSRSRCRRLYDIANVLVAMGLIKKVHYLFGTKKIPLFVYCGPEPDENPDNAATHMKEFLDRVGIIDPSHSSSKPSSATKPPPSKIRRVASEYRSAPLRPVKSEAAVGKVELQRSVTLADIPFFSAPAASVPAPAPSPSASCGASDSFFENKENVYPPPRHLESTGACSSENSQENYPVIAKPEPRPLTERNPLVALNNINCAAPANNANLNWPFDSLGAFQRLTNNYSLNPFMGNQQVPEAKSFGQQPAPSQMLLNGLQPLQTVQPSQLSMSTDSLTLAAMYLSNFYNGQPKY